MSEAPALKLAGEDTEETSVDFRCCASEVQADLETDCLDILGGDPPQIQGAVLKWWMWSRWERGVCSSILQPDNPVV